MSDKTKKDGVSVISETPVLNKLSKLKKELDGLKIIEETPYKLAKNQVIDGFRSPIQEETKIEELVRIWASVTGMTNAYNAAHGEITEALGGSVRIGTFDIGGATKEMIQHDILLRIRVISSEERRTKLKEFVNKAEGFLSEKEKYKRFEMEVDAYVGDL